MSKFYGQVGGPGRTAKKTRCDTLGTWASAQSWKGSVTVEVTRDPDDPTVAIYVSEGSAAYGRVLYSGSMADLLRAAELRPFAGGGER